jgi:hypothetical protein
LQATENGRRRTTEFSLPCVIARSDLQNTRDEPYCRDVIDSRPDGHPPRERHLFGRERRLPDDRGERTGHQVLQ